MNDHTNLCYRSSSLCFRYLTCLLDRGHIRSEKPAFFYFHLSHILIKWNTERGFSRKGADNVEERDKG